MNCKIIKRVTSFCTPPNFKAGIAYLLMGEFLILAALQAYHVVFHSHSQPDRFDFAVVTMAVSLPLLALWLFTMSCQYKLTRELEDLAHSDGVTGLPNRRGFIRLATKAEEFQSDGILLMIDVDHFKVVNDVHGHVAGDVGLLTIASLLKKRLPSTAMAARIGGDEFAVFLPKCRTSDATTLAQDISAGTHFEAGTRTVKLTLSIGAFTVARGDSFSTMLHQADAAMYRAKSRGGARLVFGPLETVKNERETVIGVGRNVCQSMTNVVSAR